MNEPPRFERFTLPEGVKKITHQKDEKILNAAMFTIQREDHTVGNLLRMQLLENPANLFVGYRQPHPLEHYIVLKIQTVEGVTPATALDKAILELSQELEFMEEEFKVWISVFWSCILWLYSFFFISVKVHQSAESAYGRRQV